MKRRQLFEIEDQPWCPKVIRDGVTDLLEMNSRITRHYTRLAPHLKKALKKTGRSKIIDLCSGGGGPWLKLYKKFQDDGFPVEVLLTDFYPNLDALKHINGMTAKKVRVHNAPVDATKVPPDLKGFRTLFTALHHFEPEKARAIIADAVKNKEGIAVFEFTERGVLAISMMFFIPFFAWATTPFMRPFKWKRIFFTYIIPAILFTAWFDGIISCLRTYSLEEMESLTKEFDADYHFETGKQRLIPSPVPVTWLIGWPEKSFS